MNSMTYIGKVFSNVRDFYYEINGATLTGAIDVVVVEQPDGTFTCSPFHVRFGKLGVLRSREKIVDIEINGEPQDIHMKLGESGEAFFVEEVQSTDCESIPAHLATSPIPVSEFEELFTAATKSDKPRRNSVDLGCNTAVVASIAAVISDKQQVSDYTQRRYTGGTDREYAMQKRDFVARQVELGNLSTESMNSSLCMDLNVADSTFDNVDHHEQEGVFQMEELETEGPKVFIAETVEDPQTLINDFIPIKTEDSVNKLPENIEKSEVDSKNGKKRRRKKSIMKKKNAQRKQSVGNNEQNFINDKDSTSEKMSDISDESKTDLSTEKSQGGSEETEDTIIDNEPQTNARNINRDPDFHFFSDTELTANSINTSRPGSPIQSDSEFEFSQRKPEPEIDGQSWAWGQLPTTAAHIEITAADKEVQKTTERNSMLSGMFSFMKQSNRLRHAKDSEGLYLTELSSGTIDPEVAALYFPRKTKATTEVDDCESGNGPSLPQSPNSMEGAKSVDSDFEEAVKDIHKYLQDISISLCGWMEPPSSENFLRHLIPFSNLCNNPAILDSPDLVVRLNGKYYSWKTAVPLVMSLIIYQRPLPQSTVDQLCTMHMPENTLQDKISKEESKSYSWWRWRSSKRPSTDASTTQPSELAVNEKPKQEVEDVIDGPEVIRTTENTVITIESDTIGSSKIDGKEQQNEDAGGYSGSQSSEDSDHAARDISETKVQKEVSRIMGDEKYRKTLRLSSEQIANLNLNDGMNEVEFSVTTAYQGTTRCKCHIYKWRFDDKIVISDIDGTITKSDVLGHILPIVGKDWAQSGVAQLFTKIKNNGYKLLYLSARAIGQARVTREYLRSIKQGDLSLPDGPLLLNPTSLISAFHREVIERKPEQFKIQCLSDIQALFPPDSNPFYAGYGNRINDVWAYRAVGIPIVRIFTINHKGELKHELTQTFQSSYSNMSNFVDQMFPPLIEAANDYSQFIYWREPLPTIEEVLPDL